jgi:hypothetical protein
VFQLRLDDDYFTSEVQLVRVLLVSQSGDTYYLTLLFENYGRQTEGCIQSQNLEIVGG